MVVLAGVIAIGGAVVGAGSARAALSEVHLGGSPGTFYFDDASAGDGRVEIRQGDQIRFVADDGGQGGKPHSAKVDELGIDSGSLSRGQTFTTPPIEQAGTFKLYCKFHEGAGHWSTLVVVSDGRTTTTSAPSTTVTSTVKPSSTTSTGGPATSSTTVATVDGSDSDGAAVGDGFSDSTIATTDTTLASTGLGEVRDEDLPEQPINPRSLEAALGRPPATVGPWTRSVRMALVLLPVLLGVATVALVRYRRQPAESTEAS